MTSSICSHGELFSECEFCAPVATIDTKFRTGVPVTDRDVSAGRFNPFIGDMEPKDEEVFEKARQVVAQIRGREKAETYLRLQASGRDVDEDFLDLTLPATEITDVPPPAPSFGWRQDGNLPTLYRGALNVVFGQDGHGKSMYFAVIAAQTLNSGKRVMWLTNEMALTQVKRMVIEQGASSEMLHNLSIGPLDSLTEEGASGVADRLNGLIEKYQADLTLLDSGSRMLSNAGADSNSADDVTAYWSPLERVAIQTGTGLALIDHVGQDKAKIHPAGSRAKMRMQGSYQYIYSITSKPLTPSQHGGSKIKLIKDNQAGITSRGGELNKVIAELRSEPGTRACSLVGSSYSSDMQEGLEDMGSRNRALLGWIAEQNSEGNMPSNNMVRGAVEGDNTMINQDLDRWVREGWIEIIKGARNANLHRVTEAGIEALANPDEDI